MAIQRRECLEWLVGAGLATRACAAQEPGQTPEEQIYKVAEDRILTVAIEKPPNWKSSDRRPAVVFFFGGGWVGGNPEQFRPQSEYLASRGMVGFRVTYRVIPRGDSGPPVVCVQDARSAIRWVRAHAIELGVDPRRIASAGGSAGGHLAAATAMLSGPNDPSDDLVVSAAPNALILFNPVYDNGPGEWGHARVGERYREFSPAHNIRVGAPPTLVFLGTSDSLIPVATARRFQDAMRSVGARSELLLYEGQSHGFFNREPYRSRTLLETDRFLASFGWLSGDPTIKPL